MATANRFHLRQILSDSPIPCRIYNVLTCVGYLGILFARQISFTYILVSCLVSHYRQGRGTNFIVAVIIVAKEMKKVKKLVHELSWFVCQKELH